MAMDLFWAAEAWKWSCPDAAGIDSLRPAAIAAWNLFSTKLVDSKLMQQCSTRCLLVACFTNFLVCGLLTGV